MSLDLEPRIVLDALGGVFVMLLGLYVAALKPRRRANIWFAVFAVSFGFAFVPNNIVVPDDVPSAAVNALQWAGYAIASIGLIGLGLAFPRSLTTAERWILFPAALAAAGILAVMAAGATADWTAVARWQDQTVPGHPWRLAASAAWLATIPTLLAAFTFVLVLMAFRFASALRSAPGTAGQFALLGGALGLWPAVFGGTILFVRPPSVLWTFFLAQAVSLVVVGALWLRNAALASGREARAARDVALVTLGALLAGILAGAWSTGGGQFGAARVATVLILAYAILRHQLLGLDVRVKRTVKQSTVAAAFIGVFFVVSESAQSLFSESLGTFVGIAAAGMLVFAIAPLQRAAERVASAAMPGVKAPSEMSAADRARVYREAVRGAWADGTLSRDEREMLERLAGSLGLSDADAKRLEREAARGVA